MQVTGRAGRESNPGWAVQIVCHSRASTGLYTSELQINAPGSLTHEYVLVNVGVVRSHSKKPKPA